MNERRLPDLLPADEDPVVHGYLSLLPPVQPRQPLETAVLTHVWRPPPRWVRQAQREWNQMIETGRIWFVIGAFAAGSLIPLCVAIGLSIAFAPQINAIGGWMLAEFGPEILALIGTYWAAASQSLAVSLGAVAPANLGIWVTGATVVGLVCALGLFLTIRRGS